MEKSVKIIKLDINELDDLSGVDAISIVSEPAIEENFMFFSKTQPHMFESYADYPDAVSNNAKRGIELNEKENNKCATQVGKVRAQQLAQKEAVSVDTIKRMYSYLSRAEEYYDENDTTACGTISYLLWGGLAAKRWSEAKLKELGLFEGAIDVASLPDYVNEPSGSLIVKDVFEGEKISFDYDETLTTEQGMELAKRKIAEGYEVYIISARQDKEPMLNRADELGIPHSRVFATGSNKAKVEKVLELGIVKHYDNNKDVVAELGIIGEQFVENAGGFSVGDYVSWTYAGRGKGDDRARGQITDLRVSGEVNVPGTDFTLTATEERPVALIETIDGSIVGQYVDNLRQIQKPEGFDKAAEDKEMVDGIIELIIKVEDLENRKQIVMDTLRDFAEEGVIFNLEDFLQRVGVEMSQLEFVTPSAGETEDDFLGRCIPTLLGEGYDQEQAAAICYSYWRERYEEDKRIIQNYVSRVFDLLGYLDGLPVFATPQEAEEVAKLAGCEGYHEHQIGEYVVYMPCNEHDPSMDSMLQEAYEEWKKINQKSWDELSPAEQMALLEQLDKVGEEDVVFKREFINTSAIRRAAKPDDTSFMDSPYTRIRYKYVGPRDSKNRDFCALMLDLNKVYRKEDINNMSLEGVNTGFGPGPKNNFYDIFLYKGGKYCRHSWETITQFYNPQANKWGRYETTKVEKPFDLLKNPSSGLALIGGEVVNPSDIVTSRFNRQEFQDQQVLAGPFMVPDKLIYRYDEMNGEYFVYFPEDAIKKIAHKFMEKKYTDKTNIEHDSSQMFDDVFVVESWLVADPKRDKSLVYSGGKEYPKGTWYGLVKVKNSLLWNEYIKTGLLKGFSVEGFFLDELLNKKQGKFE